MVTCSQEPSSIRRTNMFGLTTVLFLLQTLPYLCHSKLFSCNDTVSRLSLCTLVSDYEQSLPPEPFPMKLGQSVTLYSVADINEAQSTMTLRMHVSIWWNDTRIGLKSNDPNE